MYLRRNRLLLFRPRFRIEAGGGSSQLNTSQVRGGGRCRSKSSTEAVAVWQVACHVSALGSWSRPNEASRRCQIDHTTRGLADRTAASTTARRDSGRRWAATSRCTSRRATSRARRAASTLCRSRRGSAPTPAATATAIQPKPPPRHPPRRRPTTPTTTWATTAPASTARLRRAPPRVLFFVSFFFFFFFFPPSRAPAQLLGDDALSHEPARRAQHAGVHLKTMCARPTPQLLATIGTYGLGVLTTRT